MTTTSSGRTPSRRFPMFIWMGLVTAILGCLIHFYSDISGPSSPVLYSNFSDKLGYLEQISSHPFHGCESLVYFNDTLYTGTLEGQILKFDSTGVHVFLDLRDTGCLSGHNRTRPLGMRLSLDSQQLFISDAFQGLLSVTLSSGSCTKVFPVDSHFQVTFFNDLDILPNGTILLSESSTKYSVEDVVQIVYEETPSGRVLSIDPDTGNWQVVLDGLSFPNGIQLHHDNRSVLIVETATSRILRLFLDSGDVSVFADTLPGIADNLRKSPRGGYWVPVSNSRSGFFKTLHYFTRKWTILRWIALKASTLPLFKHLKYTKSAMLLRLNDDGKIIESLVDPHGRVLNVAEVCEQDGLLFTGSFFLPYIGRLQL